MRALTPGGSPLKRSRIFRAHFRPSKMHFIAGIPGSTQRLASCGLKHHTVTKTQRKPSGMRSCSLRLGSLLRSDPPSYLKPEGPENGVLVQWDFGRATFCEQDFSDGMRPLGRGSVRKFVGPSAVWVYQRNDEPNLKHEEQKHT